MKSKFFFILALILGTSYAVNSKAVKPDAVENLITDEQKKVSEWLAQDEDLPQAYLLGDKSGIQVYAEYMESADYEKLCGSLNLDELMGAVRGEDGQEKIPVSIESERVREIIGDSCLVRPKDVLLAVGEGWEIPVTVTGFELRKTQPVCSYDAPYSFWGSFSETLPSEPLFFVSGSSVTAEGTNGFIGAASINRSTVTAEDFRCLEEAIKFIDEYSVVAYEINAPNCEKVFGLKKREIKLEDSGDPGEILLWKKGEKAEILEMEVIEKTAMSGHVNLEGVFDFNGDGFADLWVRGDQNGCVYNLLFLGGETGFERIKLPSRPCSC